MPQNKKKDQPGAHGGRPRNEPHPAGEPEDPRQQRPSAHEDNAEENKMDEREMARRNAKPRSARHSDKGPNERRASRARNDGKA